MAQVMNQAGSLCLQALPTLALALGACGGSEARPATTTTTSAELQAQRSEVHELTKQRDDARTALTAARAGAMEQAIQHAAVDADARRQRDALATKAWNALDAADDELLPLRERALSAPEPERARLEEIVGEALKKKGHVKANLEALTCDQILDWATFHAQTEQAISALETAVQNARSAAGAPSDPPDSPTPPTKKKVGRAAR